MINIMDDKFEKLGQLIDRIENLSFALNMPIPDNTHVQSFRESLPEIVKELKESFIEISGENPWS
jgi:hypothetical protein